MDKSQSDTSHEGVVPCGTRGENTWHMCHATLMHEHGSGRVRGMENTWPSNGHVSNRFEGGVLHPKPILFDGKGVKKREKKGRKIKEEKERKEKEGKEKKR